MRSNLSTTGICFFGAISLSAPVSAQVQSAPSLWEHNGSIVSLSAVGERREFFYKHPREGMIKEGVREDSLLFHGTTFGGRYSGTAYIFKAGCGQFPYEVSGPISDNYRRVTLKGRAPRIGKHCQIRGYISDTLVFSLIGTSASPSVSNLVQTTNYLRPFKGVWSDTERVCHGSEEKGGAAIMTIEEAELTLWFSYASPGENDQVYGGCGVTIGRTLSPSSVVVDLDCDHPGHSQKRASFIKLDENRIQTPFGLRYRCQ